MCSKSDMSLVFYKNAPPDCLDGYNANQTFKKSIDSLLEFLKVASEDLFETCGAALVACNGREEFIYDLETGHNILINKCRSDGEACSHMIEAAMVLLNENTGASGDTQLLHGVLNFFEGCFASTETSDAMYRNDMNVLIDISLREAHNLPPRSAVRAKYVKIIHLVILNSKWYEQKYRRSDIKR